MIDAPPVEEFDYQQFKDAIYQRNGIDLSGYEPRQVERRLRGLLAQAGVEHFAAYLDLLERDEALQSRFQAALSVHVTELFRSPDRFAEVRNTVLPRLLARRARLRVWSAGCSHGAEAFSLAMLLDDLAPGEDHEILGTDIDSAALDKAMSDKPFLARDVRFVPSPYRARYFEADGLTLRADIRRRVTFRRHDLLTDEFTGEFDLVACRNVLMYFSAPAQQRVAGALYQAVAEGGYLFTGSAEATTWLPGAGFKREGVGLYRKGEMDARG